MRRTRQPQPAVWVVLAIAPLCGCAAFADGVPRSVPASSRSAAERTLRSDRFDRFQFDLFGIPYAGIAEQSSRISSARFESGYGAGARAGIGNGVINVGLLYEGARFGEQLTGGTAELDLLLADVQFRAGFDDPALPLFGVIGAGIGAAWLDMPVAFPDDRGIAGMVRIGLELQVADGFLLELGAGVVFAGDADGTLANMGQLTLGGKVAF
jgi:hypothetical protein